MMSRTATRRISFSSYGFNKDKYTVLGTPTTFVAFMDADGTVSPILLSQDCFRGLSLVALFLLGHVLVTLMVPTAHGP